MPIVKVPPVEVSPAQTANEFIVCGFQMRERNYATGEPLVNPMLTVYWVSRLTGKIVHQGAEDIPAADVGVILPDGAIDLKGNIKKILYSQMQTRGKFPAGQIT